MLLRAEKKVMSSIYRLCKEKSSQLVEPSELIRFVGDKDVDKSELEKIITALNQDGYFDLVYSDRHGEKVYCITLTEKGKAFKRDGVRFKRNIIFRVLLSLALAVFSFLVGLVLKNIF